MIRAGATRTGEYHCKKMGMTANERLVERLKTGSTADIMEGIERWLKEADFNTDKSALLPCYVSIR